MYWSQSRAVFTNPRHEEHALLSAHTSIPEWVVNEWFQQTGILEYTPTQPHPYNLWREKAQQSAHSAPLSRDVPPFGLFFFGSFQALSGNEWKCNIRWSCGKLLPSQHGVEPKHRRREASGKLKSQWGRSLLFFWAWNDHWSVVCRTSLACFFGFSVLLMRE